MSDYEKNGIIMNTEAPFENAMEALDRGYYILGGIGLIIGFIWAGISGATILALLGLLIWWIIKANIALAKWRNLRSRQFQMDRQLPGEELIGRLTSALTPYGLRVDSSKGMPLVAYRNIRIKVVYNENGTFSLPWSQNPGSFLFDNRYITSYLNTVAVMSIVAYQMQKINLDDSVSREIGNQNNPGMQFGQLVPPRFGKKRIVQMVVVGILVLTAVGAMVLSSNGKGGRLEEAAKTKSEEYGASETTIEPAGDVSPIQTNDMEAYQFFKNIGTNTGYYSITSNAATFLEENGNLFPVDKNTAFLNSSGIGYTNFIDYNLSIKQVVKSPERYGTSLLYADRLRVMEITEEQKSDGSYYTAIIAYDENDNYQSYFIVYDAELSKVVKDSYIYVYGLPMGMSDIDSTFGELSIPAIAGSMVGIYGEDLTLPKGDDDKKLEYTADAPLAGKYAMTNKYGKQILVMAYNPNYNEYYAIFGSEYSGEISGSVKAGSDSSWDYYDDVYSAVANGNPMLTLTPNEDNAILTVSANAGYFNTHPELLGDYGLYEKIDKDGNTINYNTDTQTASKDVRATAIPEDINEQGDIYEDDYILPNSDTQLISEMGTYVQTMTSENIRLAKNEIYARHGRRFKDSELQRYFDAQPWYHGTIEPDEFDENTLNKIEKSNIEILNSMLGN